MYQKVQYFLKAAETGSFSQAAEALYVSPQALSKQIAALEAALGGKLFSRTARGVALTGLGDYALRKLGRVTRDFEAALEAVRDYAGSGKEQVNIGIFSALPRENLVLPLVSFLLASYPDRQFRLEMIELSEGLRQFFAGKLDLLLTNTHEQDDFSGYERLSFGSYEARVVVSLVHPWAIREGVTAEDLRREPFIKMRMENDHYSVPAESSFYENVPCSRVVEAGNFETMMVLLGQGAGFAVFPLAFMDMDRAKIKSFPYPGGGIRFTTALLYRPAARGALAEIVSGIREHFGLS